MMAAPLLLLSDLADHTRNLTSAPRAALLFDGTAGHADPLSGPRASLLGEVRAIADAALAEAEPGIVDHMNADHAEALGHIVERILGLPSPEPSGDGSWVMTGIDPEGFALRGAAGLARVEFDAPVQDAASARAALVGLTKRAGGNT